MKDKKMGRPLIFGTALIHDVKVRLDDETYEKLLEYCEKCKENKASVIRKSIKEYIKNENPHSF